MWYSETGLKVCLILDPSMLPVFDLELQFHCLTVHESPNNNDDVLLMPISKLHAKNQSSSCGACVMCKKNLSESSHVAPHRLHLNGLSLEWQPLCNKYIIWHLNHIPQCEQW
uniref:Uncharacterized protein n=1 Tax=Romanomermis culicivorax TaxID=13658 RepID=A0A915I984_ROMCU